MSISLDRPSIHLFASIVNYSNSTSLFIGINYYEGIFNFGKSSILELCMAIFEHTVIISLT